MSITLLRDIVLTDPAASNSRCKRRARRIRGANPPLRRGVSARRVRPAFSSAGQHPAVEGRAWNCPGEDRHNDKRGVEAGAPAGRATALLG